MLTDDVGAQPRGSARSATSDRPRRSRPRACRRPIQPIVMSSMPVSCRRRPGLSRAVLLAVERPTTGAGAARRREPAQVRGSSAAPSPTRPADEWHGDVDGPALRRRDRIDDSRDVLGLAGDRIRQMVPARPAPAAVDREQGVGRREQRSAVRQAVSSPWPRGPARSAGRFPTDPGDPRAVGGDRRADFSVGRKSAGSTGSRRYRTSGWPSSFRAPSSRSTTRKPWRS